MNNKVPTDNFVNLCKNPLLIFKFMRRSNNFLFNVFIASRFHGLFFDGMTDICISNYRSGEELVKPDDWFNILVINSLQSICHVLYVY